ncbi:LacI family DNA-binding transcriptional regulator [Amaricoccus tamworthensis]|uniref:LacI family DNA-binding transcriptional regulator n=1 Tax=Amaricoccus tamworthensis TaxID=57002 RepID=UPI003C7B7B2C
MERRPTIIDVAKKAGVSKSTVSLVLRNSPAVREETRVQVREAMEAIGYVYNRAAATMRSANTGLVGLVINDLRNPFFTEFATSLQMALAANGYAAVVANTDEDPALQAQVVGAMIEHGVAALIISPAYGDVERSFEPVARSGVPTMQVLRQVEPRTDLFPFAAPNYSEGGRAATRHLLEAGARRIAFVGGLEGRDVTRERMEGYCAVLAEAGIEPIVLNGRSTRQFGLDAFDRLQDQYPDCDAALCFNDLVALGMIARCNEKRIDVGTGFRIVGFDDIEESAHSWPTLSTVRCDVAAFGREIADTVLAWLENGTAPPPETRRDVNLIIRGSSAGA